MRGREAEATRAVETIIDRKFEELDGTQYEGYAFRKLVAHASVAFKVTAEQIVLKNRMKQPTQVRHAIQWGLREWGWSYPTIARLFSRDHTSVIHGVGRFQEALEAGESWALIMRQELTAPGTVKGLHDTIESMQASARADMETKKWIAEREEQMVHLRQEMAEVEVERDGLRLQVVELLKTVERVSRERDMFFSQKQEMAGRYNKKRNALVDFKHRVLRQLEAEDYEGVVDSCRDLVAEGEG